MFLQNNNKANLKLRVNGLVKSIGEFSRNLPGEEIYKLRDKLNSAAGIAPEKFDNWLNSTYDIERVKNYIKAKSIINELQQYAALAEEMRFAGAQSIISQLDDFNRLLQEEEAFIEIKN